MDRWKTHIPEGVQDYLPNECARRRQLEQRVMELFARYGYQEVETPAFEYYDAFATGVGAIRQEQMFKFFDQQGRILALRPDVTTPIARMFATRMKGFALPQRLCYLGNAFGYDATRAGRARQFTQAGVEMIGQSGPLADAEMIILAVQALKQAGLNQFKIDIGQVDFFKGLMEEAGFDPPASDEICEHVNSKNMLAIDLMLRNLAVEKRVADIFMRLPALYGDASVIDEAARYTRHPRALSALGNLSDVYQILSESGLEQHISVDLGMVHGLNYYSGIIFKGLAAHLGYPLITGGRYDHLIGSFGYDVPATGFAMGVEHICAALDRQNERNSSAPGAKDALTIALAKGRLADQAIGLLEDCGVNCSQVKQDSRKLVFRDEPGGVAFILVKPADVPTYVEHGVADIGIVGKDTLLEENRPLYEMLDLKFGACRLCIAGPAGQDGRPAASANRKVATKYPNIARRFYEAKGETIDIIKLSGSVELGPLVGLSDVILDIVESGGTLRANGLSVLEEIYPISARLVVNQVSLKTKGARIKPLIEKMRRALKGEGQ